MFISTKTFEHAFSCAFRQWRADSHCKFLHGYALTIRFVFATEELDERGWVVDFGGLKTLKSGLEALFDHKTLIAADDPLLDAFKDLGASGALKLVVMPRVGCETFAQVAAGLAMGWLAHNGLAPHVRLLSAEVAEHAANSAIYHVPYAADVEEPDDGIMDRLLQIGGELA